MKTASLTVVYEWTCDACGTLNITRPVTCEFTDEDKDEIRAEHGIDPDEQGDLVMMPTTVKCKSCAERFKAREDDEA